MAIKYQVEGEKNMPFNLNKINIDKVKFYFTTDLKQTDSSLEKSLIEFVADDNTGKYKAKKVSRLVAEEWVEIPNHLKDIPMDKLVVDHINERFMPGNDGQVIEIAVYGE